MTCQNDVTVGFIKKTQRWALLESTAFPNCEVMSGVFNREAGFILKEGGKDHSGIHITC